MVDGQEVMSRVAVRRFTIASYNVHRCVGIDGCQQPERIAAVIRELDADVVGLQEVGARFRPENDAPQLDYLAEATGLQAIGGLRLHHRLGHYGNALLSRRRILDVRRLDLSYRRKEPRGALDVDLDLDGATLRVIVTHLGLRPAERRSQVNKLLVALQEQERDVVALLGDFNEWLPGGRPLRRIHAHFGRAGAARTFPSRCAMFALDRIWVLPAEALMEVHAVRTSLARRASDHLPVRGVVAWTSRMPSATPPP
ncbi:MAG: endonuclease/exonuclease/phosphatase family protein [Planctomycetes bacterium]|nr:endonuclease/exonuclease/phosphatase family protein [Planctomycetota bacterium]MBI3844829.1 endonuclease/exonuclease/phosphatase family protein [Planctomycetota bacterium]